MYQHCSLCVHSHMHMHTGAQNGISRGNLPGRSWQHATSCTPHITHLMYGAHRMCRATHHWATCAQTPPSCSSYLRLAGPQPPDAAYPPYALHPPSLSMPVCATQHQALYSCSTYHASPMGAATSSTGSGNLPSACKAQHTRATRCRRVPQLYGLLVQS